MTESVDVEALMDVPPVVIPRSSLRLPMPSRVQRQIPAESGGRSRDHAEDAVARREALLQELRDLAATYPEDAAVRAQLAKALASMLAQTEAESAPQNGGAAVANERTAGGPPLS